MSSPGGEAGLLDGLDEQLHGLLVRRQVGREAALVAHRRREAAVVQDALEHVVGLGAPAQRLAEARRADRHDHELLEVHAVVGVHPAVQHVQHRHGQHVGVGPADGAVERDLQLRGRRLGRGQRHPEDGVGPERALLSVPSRSIIAWSTARWSRASRPTASASSPATAADRPHHALPAVAVAVVAPLDRFELTGRRPRRDGGPAPRHRCRARPRPRPSGCPGNRGSRDPRCARWCSWCGRDSC